MQLALHIGAHATDDDRLLRGLLKDKERLHRAGIVVPGPGRYRKQIRETLNMTQGSPLSPESREAMLESIVDQDIPNRLVLSAQNFMGSPQRALKQGRLYPLAETRLPALAGLFPASEIEFHLAIRNPASFVPALVQSAGKGDPGQILHNTNPENLIWSDLIHRIRTACPDAFLTVWCNEDTPMIWSQVLLSVAGLSQDVAPLQGQNDLLAEIMSQEGMERYREYLASREPMTQRQRVSVTSVFLDKFALDDEIEEELDMPGWTPGLVDRLTDAYEEDVERIAAMSDVEMILP